jgi:hypothetical protein
MTAIYQTLVAFSDKPTLYKTDTIIYEGIPWLVFDWVHPENKEWQSPKRMLSLREIPHQEHIGHKIADYIVSHPIPECLIDGIHPENGFYTIIENPDIKIVMGSA